MKPCICGSNKVTIVQTTNSQTKEPVYQPFCEECQLLGSPQPSYTSACDRWDNRPLIDELTKLIQTPFPDMQIADMLKLMEERAKDIANLINKIGGQHD